MKPTKGMSECSAPADGIIAAHCGRTEIRRFRFKGSLEKHTSFFEAKEEQKRESAIA
jgi:hypothetical protein